jgi:hypothetical protein
MNRSLIVTLCLAGILSGSFLVLDDLGAGSDRGSLPEEQVSANLVRVRMNGKWEEFPLMPLADHLCASGNQFFERYCGDDIMAPGSN